MRSFVEQLRRVSACALVTVAFLASSVAFAQSDRGTIQGLVTDQTGAVVPNAKVEITHLATGTVTALATNGEGLYTAPNLPLGDYLVLVTKDGFGPTTGDGINIRSGIQVRVDLVLNPIGRDRVGRGIGHGTGLIGHHQHDRAVGDDGQGTAGHRRRQQARHHRLPGQPARLHQRHDVQSARQRRQRG